MVVKKGKFGNYLQCLECKETLSQTEKAGICPQCGKPTQKMTSRNGKTFYGCSGYPDCNFMSWDMPNGEHCPTCNSFIVIAKDGKTKKCSNKDCDYTDKPVRKKKDAKNS